tara:strand:- start:866 stop:1051 length:186 start_codon:yes stop_codon:yes gene_type:complete
MPKSRQRKNHKKKVQQRRNKILAERNREMQEYVKKMEEAQEAQTKNDNTYNPNEMKTPYNS